MWLKQGKKESPTVNRGTFAGKWGEEPAFSLENQRNIFK
jgi:hypothetical protein